MIQPQTSIVFVGDDQTDTRKVLLNKDGAYLRTSRSVWDAAQALRQGGADQVSGLPLPIVEAAARLLAPTPDRRDDIVRPRARVEFDIAPLLRWIDRHAPGGATISTVLGISLILNIAYFASPVDEQSLHLTITNALEIVSAMFVIMVAHEVAHAAIAFRFGCRSHGIGLGIFVILPVFYADVSETWRLTRLRRIAVSSAGMAAQSVIGAVMIALLFIQPDNPLLRAVIWANLGSILINMIPFAKLDGYWIIVDALDAPNLQKDAMAIMRRLIVAGDTPARSSFFILCYALGAVLFYVVIIAAGLRTLASVTHVIAYSEDIGDVVRTASSQPLTWLFALYLTIFMMRLALRLLKRNG